MNVLRCLLPLLFCCVSSLAWSQSQVQVPPDLAPWQAFAVYGKEQFFCPGLYDNAEARQCRWPELLELNFANEGGNFKQTWTILTQTWLPLPGDEKYWPQNVTVDGRPAAVVLHDGVPAIFVEKGRYFLSGEFKWGQLPQSFPVPRLSGLISLKVNGEKVAAPFLDETGRLWIQKRDTPILGQKRENLLEVRIFRLIEDDLPFTITTLVRLTVAGETRREQISAALLKGSQPLRITSPLPVKLSENQDLWVEVRPGQWEIRLLSLIHSPVSELGPLEAPYGEEIWSFKAVPRLRMAMLEGLKPVDPSQTTLPPEWHSYPAFLAAKDDRARIKESQRGMSKTIPDALQLEREFWLDFNGGGATVRDQVGGRLGMRRFLGLNKADYQLGRLSSNGRDQLITCFGEDLHGIEMEKGPTDFSAVARVENLSSGSAFPLGWNCEFQEANGRLHLPPGWRLLGIRGGTVPDGSSWITQWSLLDFFMILIIALAVGKLRHWRWAALFWVGLALTWQEPYAPRYVWMVLVLTTALLRVLQQRQDQTVSFFKTTNIKILHVLVLIFLFANALVFGMTQLRTALYPQLAQSGLEGQMSLIQTKSEVMNIAPAPMQAIPIQEKEEETEGETLQWRHPLKPAPTSKYDVTPNQNAITQTGPGLPAWSWQTVNIRFGMVGGDQLTAFWLLSPALNSLAAVLRVLLLILLILFFFDLRLRESWKQKSLVGSFTLALLIILPAFFPAQARADFPPDSLLKELEQRLLKPHECYPHCAAINQLNIEVTPAGDTVEELPAVELRFFVSAAADTAIPLPAGEDTWAPLELLLDGQQRNAILRENGRLYMLMPEGFHKVQLKAQALTPQQLRFVFPLAPYLVTISAPDWRFSGLDETGRVENMLQLDRDFNDQKTQDSFFSNSQNHLMDFLRVRRELVLGLEWKVSTCVERFISVRDQRAISVSIPLLPGELVRTEGLEVKDGRLLLEMPGQADRIMWESSLPISQGLELEAPSHGKWSETWRLQASPWWHCTFEGIPAVAEEGTEGISWQPWPGEKLHLAFSQLNPAPGRSLTIDAVKADYHIGESYNRLLVRAQIRTSKGGSHEITPPEGAVLKQVKVNDLVLPLNTDAKTVSLPLQPGSQQVELEWHQPVKWQARWFTGLFQPLKIRFPALNWHAETSNIDIYMHLPVRFWLLLSNGPRLGPAILIWSLMGTVALLALILGKFAQAPLSTYKWLLLGLGLITLDAFSCVLAAAWFLAMEARKKYAPTRALPFNLMQIGLFLLTLLMVVTLYRAVAQGLLGVPDMQVEGNGSTQVLLHWTQDRAADLLPQPWVLVCSMYVYRMVMFLWALWLAGNVLEWSAWAFATFRQDGAWKKITWRRPADAKAPQS